MMMVTSSDHTITDYISCCVVVIAQILNHSVEDVPRFAPSFCLTGSHCYKVQYIGKTTCDPRDMSKRHGFGVHLLDYISCLLGCTLQETWCNPRGMETKDVIQEVWSAFQEVCQV